MKRPSIEKDFFVHSVFNTIYGIEELCHKELTNADEELVLRLAIAILLMGISPFIDEVEKACPDEAELIAFIKKTIKKNPFVRTNCPCFACHDALKKKQEVK